MMKKTVVALSVISFAIWAVLTWERYTFTHPNLNSVSDTLKYYTEYELPEGTKIRAARRSSPTFLYEYQSCYAVELSPEGFSEFLSIATGNANEVIKLPDYDQGLGFGCPKESLFLKYRADKNFEYFRSFPTQHKDTFDVWIIRDQNIVFAFELST